jgi:vacuolar-type H+-ATPase subunit I/STV1
MEEEISEEENEEVDEDLKEIDEVANELKEEHYSIEDDPEIQKIREYAKQIENAIKNNPRLINRVENKHDFASEVINTNSNQKIANLKDYEIQDLLEKRSFMNFLLSYGLVELANLVKLKITDVENYSLSKDGFLIERAMVENVRQSSTVLNVEQNKKKMKGGSND